MEGDCPHILEMYKLEINRYLTQLNKKILEEEEKKQIIIADLNRQIKLLESQMNTNLELTKKGQKPVEWKPAAWAGKFAEKLSTALKYDETKRMIQDRLFWEGIPESEIKRLSKLKKSLSTYENPLNLTMRRAPHLTMRQTPSMRTSMGSIEI